MLNAPFKLTPLSLALALVIGATLSGCSTTPSSDNDQPASQTQSGDEAPDESSESESGSEIPSWIEENFPIYPDSEVSTVSGSGPVIIGLMIQGDVGDEVVDWYNAQYTQNGWEQNLVQNEGARFNAENSEGYMAVVGITSMSTASVVTLTATKPIA